MVEDHGVVGDAVQEQVAVLGVVGLDGDGVADIAFEHAHGGGKGRKRGQVPFLTILQAVSSLLGCHAPHGSRPRVTSITS